jgi:hypothetical protein
VKKRTRKKIANHCLLWAMFFLPFGYDALFKLAMDITGSYWSADVIFYLIFLVLFSMYLYFSNTNPIKVAFKWKKKLIKMVKMKMPFLFKKPKRSRVKRATSKPVG